MTNEDAKEFLSLFKHKSAIDPRSITGAITLNDSDDDDDLAAGGGATTEAFRLETNKKTSRKRGANKSKQAPSIKKSKSEGRLTSASEEDGASSTTTTKASTRSRKAKKSHSEILVLDDDEGDYDFAASSSPSLLTPSVAAVLEKVNENKKLRAQLKNSIDSPTTADTSNNHHTTRHSHYNTRATSSNNNNNNNNNSSSKTNKNIYTVDSDDEEPTKATTTTSTSPPSSSASAPTTNNNNSTASNVLFFVHASVKDTRPLKFRCLQNEGFAKLLQAYCKYKGVDSEYAGFKWYGLPLDPRKTPLSYEMTEEEQLYYYDKRNSSSSSGDGVNVPRVNEQENNNNTSDQHTTSNGKTTTTSTSTVTTSGGTGSTSSVDEKVQPAAADKQDAQDAIILKLRDGDVIQKFRIKRTDPMKKLIDGYATKQLIDPKLITLFFDGLALLPTHTPEDHDMETDDIIEVKKTT